MPARPILMSWSGGKDSALALGELLADPAWTVEALVTTVTEEFDRVSMHGVRRALLAAQAETLGLPLVEVRIPKGATNEAYERAFAEALAPYHARGVVDVGFGDLFLEDIRAYREKFVAGLGMEARFPIWRRETPALARAWVDGGHRAVVVCVDPRQLDGSFAGRWLDGDFLSSLPAEVDPCGENGEFHTFVTSGPGFRRRLEVEVGPVVERDGFVFADVAPRTTGDAGAAA